MNSSELRNLLSLVACVKKNQGLPVASVMKITGISNMQALLKLLESIQLFGIPPFGPDDLLLYRIEDNRLFIDFPSQMHLTNHLTQDEIETIRKIITEAILNQSTEELAGLYSKIMKIPFSVEDPFESKRILIEEAIEEDNSIQFLYKTLASKELEQRIVDPWMLFNYKGITYLIGYCHMRKNTRNFHLARMDGIEILDEKRTKTPPSDVKEIIKATDIFNTSKGYTVKLCYRAEAENSLNFMLHLTNIEQEEEWHTAECKIRDTLWFVALLRSYGTDAYILSPDHLKNRFMEELELIEHQAKNNK